MWEVEFMATIPIAALARLGSLGTHLPVEIKSPTQSSRATSVARCTTISLYKSVSNKATAMRILTLMINKSQSSLAFAPSITKITGV